MFTQLGSGFISCYSAYLTRSSFPGHDLVSVEHVAGALLGNVVAVGQLVASALAARAQNDDLGPLRVKFNGKY